MLARMSTTELETVRHEVGDGVMTLTLNRPDRLNAYTHQMKDDVIAALDAADRDNDVRVVIVTGAGRGFCAGADLAAGAATFELAGEGRGATPDGVPRDTGGIMTLRMFECRKPLIGAINGPAVGIGATMTLPMDIRLASQDARFGFVFARRGIVPEAASSWFLPRLVGIAQAMEWVATGRVFDADEALRGGLVRSVHAPDDLLPAARALAREIADTTAPVSVALSRQMMWRMLGASHPMDAHRADSRGIFLRGRSADAAEGVTAFLEKRDAVFPDRVSDGLPEVFPDWRDPEFG